jgi:XisI protein
MVTLNDYRERIQQLLAHYQAPPFLREGVETQLIVDTQHDHYQLVNVGWNKGQRVYGCVVHIDIIGDKVWLQQNLTDQLVAEDLVELGIPKEQIVLGFQPVYMRPHTGFGTN